MCQLRWGRRFVGVELKASYYQQAVANLRAAKGQSIDLFSNADEPEAEPDEVTQA